jgi:DNA (cytosine-5)-methyltransferase 1
MDEGHVIAFAQNTRDEVRIVGDGTISGSLSAHPGMKQTTYISTPKVRRLTPLECERLQGFPDDWTLVPSASDSQRYKQMGNAVAVPVARWIFENIVYYG